jgi:hypothetical protein
MPIFRVYTILDTNDVTWKILHDPTHEELKTSISGFIKKIIQVTKVAPRVEKIFRAERESRIASIKKDMEESEKAGGAANNNRFGAGRGGMRNPADVNFQNMTEEEREEEWRKRW